MTKIESAASALGKKGGEAGLGDSKRREPHHYAKNIQIRYRNHIHTFPARFWNMVKVGANTVCWEWTRCKTPKGYGQIRLDSITYLTHRVAWELTFGSIPDGLQICHSCDNPPCCNPIHLFLGTPDDNSKDMLQKERNLTGEEVHFAKLTTAQVLEIRQRGSEDRECLASEFNVHPHTITHIVTRKTWKRV